MAKKITSQDLFEGDIFATVRESVEQTIGKIQTLNSELTESAKLMKGSASGIKTDSAKGQKDFNKFTQEANQLKREKIELEKQEAQLQALLNKAKQEELKAAKAANAEAERQAKAQDKAVKQAQAESSAYAQKSKKLRELSKEYKDLAVQNKENTAEAQKLLTEIQDLDAELKRVDATVGQHQRNVGNYGEATQNLKKELRELTKALQTMESTDPRFQEMAKKAGELKDQIQDTQAVIKATAGSPVENLGTGLSKAGKVGIDAFAGMTGAMGLFGIQSEEAMKTMAKLQELAAMSEALQSLGSLGDTMTEVKAAFGAAFANSTLFNKATVAQAVSTGTATTAQRVMNTVMNANPIFLIIGAVTALVGAYALFSDSTEDAEKAQAKLNAEMERNLELLSDLQASTDDFMKGTERDTQKRIAQLKLQGATQEEIFKAEQQGLRTSLELQKNYTSNAKREYDKALNNTKVSREDFLKFQKAYFDSLDKESEIRFKIEMNQLDKEIEAAQKAAEKKKQAADQYAADRKSALERIRQAENDYALSQLSDVDREVKLVKTKYDELIALGIKYKIDVTKLTEASAKEQNDIRLKYEKEFLAKQRELKEASDVTKAETKVLELELKLKKAAGLEAIQIEFELQQARMNLLKEQEEAELLAAGTNEEEKLKIRAEYANKRYDLEQEFKTKSIKTEEDTTAKTAEELRKQMEERNKWAQTVADFYVEQSNRKIAQMDKEKAAAESQFNYLKELAAQGNIDAKESLAEQQRIIDEANAKKERELKRQQRIKLAEAIYSTYNSKVAAGSENPLMETMRDAALLQQFIMSLPTFFDGTEDTGINGKGVDGKGGFHAILHPNERVIPKSLNDHIGGMSNEALTKLAMEYQAGKVVRSDSQIGSAYETAILASKIDELNETIRNKPETNIELGEITQSVMNIVKSSKQGHTTIYNRYRIRS